MPKLIEEANVVVRKQLRDAVGELTWRNFESKFLVQVLEALGFEEVRITKPTRDGGKDGCCTYRRGLVQSQPIVSAKHQKTQTVGANKIQRLRGIKGDADTAIIVTSSSFTSGAIEEAKPGENQGSIYLVNGDRIVDACMKNSIGVRPVTIPRLYAMDVLMGSNHDR